MNFLKKLYPIFYSLFLLIFTAYVLLDTFVIKEIYETVTPPPSSQSASNDGNPQTPSTNNNNNAGNNENNNSSVISSTAYTDENISITLKEYNKYNTVIYVADVQVTSPEYLKTAFAKNAYGKNVTEKTTDMAKNNSAILAINGDYYGSREKGYVIRNGKIYRSSAASNQEDLVIYKDGSFEIINEKNITAEQLLANGAYQVLSFGPALVTNRAVSVGEKDEVGKAMASNPRTAIGVIDDLHYIFVVSDGRTHESEGLTLFELANFMRDLGAVNAYNLDGGGSSTMYFNGKLINNPTTNGNRVSERSVSDIVYIGY